MKFVGYEVQAQYEGTIVLCFLSKWNSLSGVENMCLYPSDKNLYNDLFWQNFLMAGGPFACLFQRTSRA